MNNHKPVVSRKSVWTVFTLLLLIGLCFAMCMLSGCAPPKGRKGTAAYALRQYENHYRPLNGAPGNGPCPTPGGDCESMKQAQSARQYAREITEKPVISSDIAASSTPGAPVDNENGTMIWIVIGCVLLLFLSRK